MQLKAASSLHNIEPKEMKPPERNRKGRSKIVKEDNPASDCPSRRCDDAGDDGSGNEGGTIANAALSHENSRQEEALSKRVQRLELEVDGLKKSMDALARMAEQTNLDDTATKAEVDGQIQTQGLAWALSPTSPKQSHPDEHASKPDGHVKPEDRTESHMEASEEDTGLLVSTTTVPTGQQNRKSSSTCAHLAASSAVTAMAPTVPAAPRPYDIPMKNSGHCGLVGNFDDALAAEKSKSPLAPMKKQAIVGDTFEQRGEDCTEGRDDLSGADVDTPEEYLTGPLALSNDTSSGHDQEFLRALDQKLHQEASARANPSRNSASDSSSAARSLTTSPGAIAKAVAVAEAEDGEMEVEARDAVAEDIANRNRDGNGSGSGNLSLNPQQWHDGRHPVLGIRFKQNSNFGKAFGDLS